MNMQTGTQVVIPFYRGTCGNCGGPIAKYSVNCVFIGIREDGCKLLIPVTPIFCPICKQNMGRMELYNSEWEASMMAWSN